MWESDGKGQLFSASKDIKPTAASPEGVAAAAAAAGIGGLLVPRRSGLLISPRIC